MIKELLDQANWIAFESSPKEGTIARTVTPTNDWLTCKTSRVGSKASTNSSAIKANNPVAANKITIHLNFDHSGPTGSVKKKPKKLNK